MLRDKTVEYCRCTSRLNPFSKMSKEKILVVESFNGLANRLRVIDSALCLSRILNAELKIIWPLGDGLLSKFDELFIVPKSLFTISYYNPSSLFHGLQRKFTLKVFFNVLSLDSVINHDMLYDDKFSRSYLRTCERIGDLSDSYSWLVPNDTVEYRISENYNGVNLADLCGVHIRRSDNKKSSEISTTEIFIDKIRMELLNSPERKFLLCSDDYDEIVELKSIFGDRIICKPDINRNRYSHDGVLDAAADFIALSRTKLILGSYWSSFGIEAAKVGAIKFYATQ